MTADADRGAWSASELTLESVAFDLSRRQADELETALQRALEHRLEAAEITAENFPLPSLAADIDRLRKEIRHGRGIALIRGWPLAGYNADQAGLMFYGFGTHFGTSLPQSVMGDHVGHVADFTHEDPHQRAYRNRMALPAHTDHAGEMVGMLCLQPAATGGRSFYVSALTVHQTIARERPGALGPLYEGFYYHRRGEEAPGEKPITPHKVPVYASSGGVLSCRYIRSRIRAASNALDEPIPEDFAAAQSSFEEIASRSALTVNYRAARGDAVFHNNCTVLHGRDAFAVSRLDASRRHFIRLWLQPERDPRPIVKAMEIFSNGATRPQSNRKPVFDSAHFDGTIYRPSDRSSAHRQPTR